MKATDVLLDIAAEKNGFKLGDPWRFSEFSLAAIIPVQRDVFGQRDYRLLSEVTSQVLMKDSGSIDHVSITNKSAHPVLVKAGEVVGGATQARTLVISQIIMSGENVLADCVCVHASHGIRAGQEVKSRGYSPSRVRQTLYKGFSSSGRVRSMARSRGGRQEESSILGASFGYSSRLQNEVWGDVRGHSRDVAEQGDNLGAYFTQAMPDIETPSPSGSWRTAADDLSGRINESKEKFEAVLKKVPRLEDQVGIVLLGMGGFDSMESFEHSDSWKALVDDFLKSEAGKIGDVSDQEGVFDFKPERAREIIRGLLQAQFEEMITVNKMDTATFLLESDKLKGEVVTLYDVPIHCTFMKKA